MIPLALKGAFKFSSRQHAPASRIGLSITRICPIIECLSHPEGLISGALTQVMHIFFHDFGHSNDWLNILLILQANRVRGPSTHDGKSPEASLACHLINVVIGMNGWSQRASNPEQVTLQASPCAHRYCLGLV